MEINNLMKAFENLGKALADVFKRFRELIIAAAKKVWDFIKKIQDIEERRPKQAMIYLWQEQQQLHQHQVINRMKVQERIMISYQQPWKAWKAQRR